MQKKSYESPRLTVVTFNTERGYAQSTLTFTMLASVVAANNTPNTASLEAYEDREGWGSSDNTFWN